MLRLVAAAAAGLAVAGCALPLGIGLPSTSQLVNGAADNLSTSNFEKAGSFVYGGDTFTVDVQWETSGSAHLDYTRGAIHFELLQVGGKVYYQGHDAAEAFAGADAFGQAQPIVIGDRWFSTKKGTAVSLTDIIDPSSVKAAFLNTLSFTRKDDVSFDGADTAELSNADAIINITESSPYQLVRVRTRPGRTVTGMSDVDFTFSNYGKAFAITAPPGALDMDDPASFPPFYTADTVSNARCNDPCILVADLVNRGGLEGAPAHSTVTFALTSDADGSSLGTCKVTISPDVPNGQKVTESCAISSPEWSAFVGNYHYSATADNPAYD